MEVEEVPCLEPHFRTLKVRPCLGRSIVQAGVGGVHRGLTLGVLEKLMGVEEVPCLEPHFRTLKVRASPAFRVL